MLKRFVTAVVLVFAAPSALAMESFEAMLSWRLGLAADGTITELAPANAIPDALRGKLEAEIRTWRFQSGKLGGTSAPSETSLNLRIRGESSSGGPWSVTLLGASTGSRMRKTVAPRYPDSAVASRRQGLVLVLIEFDADGKVTSSTVAKESPVRIGALVSAAREAANQYEFEPERVGGRAVAGAALLPVCFQLRREPIAESKACAWKRPGDKAPFEDAQAVALDPMIKLETDISGRVL